MQQTRNGRWVAPSERTNLQRVRDNRYTPFNLVVWGEVRIVTCGSFEMLMYMQGTGVEPRFFTLDYPREHQFNVSAYPEIVSALLLDAALSDGVRFQYWDFPRATWERCQLAEAFPVPNGGTVAFIRHHLNTQIPGFGQLLKQKEVDDEDSNKRIKMVCALTW